MRVLSGPRDPSEAEQDRVHALIVPLDSLLDAPEASARLVAAGRVALDPLREFLIGGKPRSVPEPRIRAVRALAGLGADGVLLEYLRRPISSDDAILRFAEETVRNTAARALADSARPGVDEVLLDLASAERLPAALTAIVSRASGLAIPILISALEDDFARDAASDGLRRCGVDAREPLDSQHSIGATDPKARFAGGARPSNCWDNSTSTNAHGTACSPSSQRPIRPWSAQPLTLACRQERIRAGSSGAFLKFSRTWDGSGCPPSKTSWCSARFAAARDSRY